MSDADRAEIGEGYGNAPARVVTEVIQGELALLPRPRPRELRATLRLGARLAPFDAPQGDDPGGWVDPRGAGAEPRALPELVVPDLAGWHRERLPEAVFTDDEVVRIDIAPDWVCEVLSPSTATTDRADKLEIYRREGAGHAWIVDPTLRLVEVFRRAAEGWLRVAVFERDERVRAEPFEADRAGARRALAAVEAHDEGRGGGRRRATGRRSGTGCGSRTT